MTQAQKGRGERVGQKVSATRRSYPPFIRPSLYGPPTVPSVIPRVPSVLAPFVWLRPESGGPRQKNAACHGQRAKVSARRGRRRREARARPGVRDGEALSKLWPPIVAPGLGPDPAPRRGAAAALFPPPCPNFAPARSEVFVSAFLTTFCHLFGLKRSADVSGPGVPVTPLRLLLNNPDSSCFLNLCRFSGAFLWFRPHFSSLWAGNAPFSR